MIKNRIKFIFLLILAFIFLYNFGGFVPSLFFNVILSAFIFSVGFTVFAYFRFKFSQSIDRDIIIKGEQVKLNVKLSNKDLIIYPFVSVSFFNSHSLFKKYSFKQSLSVNPLSKKVFSFEMDCKYRGQYEVGISNIYIEDFLGLIRLKYKIPKKMNIVVHPRIEQLSSFHAFTSESPESPSSSPNSVEDATNIKDVRNYRHGDTFKKIHWKLSAKSGGLMIKNYQNSQDNSISLLLDLRKNIYPDEINIAVEDKLIETAVAIMHYYLMHRVPVNYLFFNQKVEMLKLIEQGHFDYLYNTLATVEFNQTIPLSDFIKLYYDINNTSAGLIVLTGLVDADLYNEISKAHQEGKPVCLAYVSPGQIPDVKDSFPALSDARDIAGKLQEIGVCVYTIDPDDDIKKVLGGIADA